MHLGRLVSALLLVCAVPSAAMLQHLKRVHAARYLAAATIPGAG